ncbi:LysR substrate-binding domain-containing protein [Sphingomonas cavernae]|uniref:LysR family transcriptional regulator n=1 Tax=Sphingomonas cavernae TaxID=2320861 RepID=A0A418WUQ6_9SPHN|nr:LysR substrate-binding domain-containing protein [Sphingomonas cavernae]RJF96408.1 LysR family transcriptional regulator [Sphingomonas cavernae]
MAHAEQRLKSIENRFLAKLKLRQLKLLIAVAEHGSILRAANALNVAQPAATKMIRDLEGVLDMELFERSPRGVKTTLYGDVVVRHAKLILAQVRHASEELFSLNRGAIGKVAVGTLLSAVPPFLPGAIVAMRAQRAGIKISVLEGMNDMLMGMLRVGDLDIVVGRLPEYREHEDLVREILYNDPASIVVREGHPLCDLPVVTLADLQREEWIAPPPHSALRRDLDECFNKAGLEPPMRAIESVSIATNYAVLRHTNLVAALPSQVAEAQAGLVQLPVDFALSFGAIGVTLRASNDRAPATDYFLSIVRQMAHAAVAPPIR